MTEARTGFTIVLLIDDPVGSAKTIAQALAAARNVPPLDVAREARSCWGLVGDHRPEDEAQSTVAALKELGLPSAIVPTDHLPSLAGIQVARKIEIEAGGFRCKLSRGVTPLIPWTAPVFLAAAIIRTRSFKSVSRREGPSKSEKLVRIGLTLATGIPIPGARTQTVTSRQETSATMAVLDIAIDHPAGRIRLEGDRTDLSYLGDRRTYDSLGNFKLMISEASSYMAKENVNFGARTILAQASPTNPGYDTLAELEREERWLMARRALRQGGQ